MKTQTSLALVSVELFGAVASPTSVLPAVFVARKMTDVQALVGAAVGAVQEVGAREGSPRGS